MKCIDLTTEKAISLPASRPIIAAVGNFDGVHLGHMRLIHFAKGFKDIQGISAVWSFATPASLCLGRTDSLLTTTDERLALFRASGVELAITEDFERVRDLTPPEFAKMLTSIGISTVVCGSDFRYGKNAAGTAASLADDMKKLGGTAVILPPVEMDGGPISSTRIRTAIKNGSMEEAAAMLGRPYSVSGTVISGKRLGRTLGFPTANIRFASRLTLPRFGVYAVRILMDGKAYTGVANVGIRPTVESREAVNCETYIFGFHGELYGKSIRIAFCRFQRPEMKFEDIKALCRAMENDTAKAKAYFKTV